MAIDEFHEETTRAVRLMWQVCHLCNVINSQLSSYLSLEALQRDTLARGLAVPIPHAPIWTAQASMMVDTARNLDAAVSALLETKKHEMFLRDAAYHSLLDAASLLGGTMGKCYM